MRSAVTYEMLAGEPPFTASNPQAVLAKVITDRAPSLMLTRELVPPHISAAVDKGLAKLPADRFGSAAEFSNALSDARIMSGLSLPHQRAAASRWSHLPAVAALGVALAAVAWGASRRSAPAPSVYDVALPDSAPLAFRYTRNLSISPDGGFIIYSGASSDSARSQLWYRGLLDATSRAIPGTEEGFEPNISPDGRWVLFATESHLKIASLATSDAPRILGEHRDPIATRWVSATRFFLIDDDGNTLRWFDPQVGETSSSSVYYCISPEWLEASESLLCGGGGQKFARVVRPGSTVSTLRIAANAGGGLVTGAQFRVIDERYLVYMSIEGELRAASFDAASRTVGRSVTLVSGIRREAYRGDGQWAVAPNGTLVYALGDNAEVGHLVRARNRSIERLPLEPAAFLRYDMSPDGRRIAAVLQGPNGHELRIYDARDGRYQPWIRSPEIGHAIWSPRSDRLAVSVWHDSLRGALMVGSPDASSPPDTLVVDVGLNAMSWRSDSLLIGNTFSDNRLVWQVLVGRKPARLDTILHDAVFPDLSHDGRLLSYAPSTTTGVLVTTFPPSARRIHVSPSGGEPHWVTSRRLRYRAGGYASTSWHEVDIDPTKADAVSPPRLVHTDPRFSDTPGWSQRTTSAGDLIYVQTSARTSASYVRVVPNWVSQMKRVVDETKR
jgi:eukaryotic-like serine/threonine-protein kinase